MKTAAPIISSYLKTAFNKCIAECVFPRSLKIAKIIYIDDLGADENWQSEIIKYADDTVLIEKLDHKSQDGKLLECWMSRNGVDCNYMKTKFTVLRKDQLNIQT